MHCRQAETLIPLHAGADLPAADRRALRAHLDACAGCRDLHAAFVESRDWLRAFAAPPLSEAALDAMRASVHRELARRPVRTDWWWPRWAPRFAMAAAACLLLALAGVFVGRPRTNPPLPPVALRLPASPPAQEEAPARPAIPKPVRGPKRNAPARPAPLAPEPGLVAATHPVAPPAMLRIELHTADPNIRIIWFAPASDAANR
jgi:Putative zinc-finger